MTRIDIPADGFQQTKMKNNINNDNCKPQTLFYRRDHPFIHIQLHSIINFVVKK